MNTETGGHLVLGDLNIIQLNYVLQVYPTLKEDFLTPADPMRNVPV